MKILVIRNDKLGDFMLAWPAISLLKQQYTESVITALVPSYTKPIAQLCPWIDDIIIDERKGVLNLGKAIKQRHFDASISLFSELRIAAALWLARVPVRVGPATKIAQIFLNRRLRQKRSLSLKPEFEYNIDLSKYFIQLNGDTPVDPAQPPFLTLDTKATLKNQYISENNIPGNKKLVLIHPGSGGSAVNLSIEQYAQLANKIALSTDVHFVITAGPDEIENARALSDLLPSHSRNVYHSLNGLANFAHFINIGDLFISGSTGPLHIAGALNIPTAAFYPARRSATALRWQTLNEKCMRRSFSPDVYIKSATTLDIDISKCADDISSFIDELQVAHTS
jgi:ADP-heptose:LPS heptosyltransferase